MVGDGSITLALCLPQQSDLAPQTRVALSSMAWNTGQAAGRAQMTRSTSEVAVCCSSDSVSSACASARPRTAARSRSQITAWSAKVVASSICRCVNVAPRPAPCTSTPIGIASRNKGDAEHGVDTTRSIASRRAYSEISQHVSDMTTSLSSNHPASDSAATRLESSAFHVVVEFGRISIGRRELENRPF